jgi:hypothetical protein
MTWTEVAHCGALQLRYGNGQPMSAIRRNGFHHRVRRFLPVQTQGGSSCEACRGEDSARGRNSDGRRSNNQRYSTTPVSHHCRRRDTRPMSPREMTMKLRLQRREARA